MKNINHIMLIMCDILNLKNINKKICMHISYNITYFLLHKLLHPKWTI